MLISAPVLTAPRERLAVRELELDEPRAGEVRVRMAASGVCHSCLYSWDGSNPGVRTPMVLGDEGAGTVDAVGPGVTTVRPGDPVVIAWTPSCGRCHYCSIGRPVLCETRNYTGLRPDGSPLMRIGGEPAYQYAGVATYGSSTVIPESCAVPIPAEMPLDRAALIGCSVMTGVGSVLNTARVEAGESLAVFGCGGVGLNAVQGGRIAGAHPLIAVDVADDKLELARRFGATHVVNPRREDLAERVRAITGRGLDYAVVAVGSVEVQESAWACLALGGTMVVAGIPMSGTLRIDPRGTLISAERCLKGCCYGSARPREDFVRLANLYLAGKLMIDELITRRYAIDQATEAFEDLERGALARGLIVF